MEKLTNCLVKLKKLNISDRSRNRSLFSRFWHSGCYASLTGLMLEFARPNNQTNTMPTSLGWTPQSIFGQFPPSGVVDDVIELPILLPEWQVLALEEMARDRNMTIGQLIRRLFADLAPRPKANGVVGD
jgi:hypothetical protein